MRAGSRSAARAAPDDDEAIVQSSEKRIATRRAREGRCSLRPPSSSRALASSVACDRAARSATAPAPGQGCARAKRVVGGATSGHGLRRSAPVGQESEAQRALRQLRLPGVHAVVRRGGGAALGDAARGFCEKSHPLTLHPAAGASGRRARPRCATPGACARATRSRGVGTAAEAAGAVAARAASPVPTWGRAPMPRSRPPRRAAAACRALI